MWPMFLTGRKISRTSARSCWSIGSAIHFAQLRMFAGLADVYRFDVRWAYLFPPLVILAISWGWLAKRI